MPNKAKFCAHCGQKDTDGRVGMGSLMVRMWNNTFHLEGKFIKTAWHLFVPGKVTQEFFKGKQERYPHPIRLFAIVMFLFLFLLNSMLSERQAKGEGSGRFIVTRTEHTEFGDSVLQVSDYSLYERMQHQAVLADLRNDYGNLPAEWRTRQARNSVDSLLKLYGKRAGIENAGLSDSSAIVADTLPIVFLSGKSIQIAALDMVRYGSDEIIHKQNITQWYDKLLVRQAIKMYKTPEAMTHTYIGSLTWTILALVALMSGILALLYWGQHRFYVEHFIFLLHFHTGAMLLLLISLVGNRFGFWGMGMVVLAAVLPVPAMYFGMLRFYGEGRFKTFLKWGVYGVLYLVATAVMFLLALVAVLAVF